LAHVLLLVVIHQHLFAIEDDFVDFIELSQLLFIQFVCVGFAELLVKGLEQVPAGGDLFF
jgi:hypothetical protein